MTKELPANYQRTVITIVMNESGDYPEDFYVDGELTKAPRIEDDFVNSLTDLIENHLVS